MQFMQGHHTSNSSYLVFSNKQPEKSKREKIRSESDDDIEIVDEEDMFSVREKIEKQLRETTDETYERSDHLEHRQEDLQLPQEDETVILGPDEESFQNLDTWLRDAHHSWKRPYSIYADFNSGRITIFENNRVVKLLPELFQTEYFPGSCNYRRLLAYHRDRLFYINDLDFLVSVDLNTLESHKSNIGNLTCLSAKGNQLFALDREGRVTRIFLDSNMVIDMISEKIKQPYVFTTIKAYKMHNYIFGFNKEARKVYCVTTNWQLNITSEIEVENMDYPVHSIVIDLVESQKKNTERVLLINSHNTIAIIEVFKTKLRLVYPMHSLKSDSTSPPTHLFGGVQMPPEGIQSVFTIIGENFRVKVAV